MRTSTKITAVLGGTALAVATAGVAYAYWTTSGNGSGSATTGTSSPFVVTVDSPATGTLAPGSGPITVNFHVKNANSGVQHLSAVTAAVQTATGGTWSSVAGCSAADYTVGSPQFTAGDIASGVTVDGTFTVSMNNLTTSQDGCKNASVPLYVSAS
ncbi:MAG: hypothetical protein ACXVGH_06305 [Mycobacteriales bacterium]